MKSDSVAYVARNTVSYAFDAYPTVVVHHEYDDYANHRLVYLVRAVDDPEQIRGRWDSKWHVYADVAQLQLPDGDIFLGFSPYWGEALIAGRSWQKVS